MTTRPTLPQNFQKIANSTIGACKSISGWTRGGDADGEMDVNNSIYLTGGASLHLHMSTVATGCTAKRAIDITFPSAPIISMNVYRPVGLTPAPIVTLYLSSGVGDIYPYYYKSATLEIYGWQTIYFYPTWNAGGGSNSWSSPQKTLRIDGKHNGAGDIYIDEIYYGFQNIPNILLSFDDTVASQYSEAFSYMSAKGIVGTCFINAASVGAVNKLTLSKLQEMYAAGWDIANHGFAHIDYVSSSEVDRIADYNAGRDYLTSNGFTRSADFFCWPNGAYNDASIANITTLGCKTARSVDFGMCSYPFHGIYRLPAFRFSCLDTLSNILGYIDNAIKTNSTILIYLHGISADPGGDVAYTSISDFQALIDYIATKNVRCSTFSEWYNGLTNPRYRSLPVARV